MNEAIFLVDDEFSLCVSCSFLRFLDGHKLKRVPFCTHPTSNEPVEHTEIYSCVLYQEMQGIPIVEESSISVKQMEPQQIPTELSKLVIRRQQVLDLYVQKQQELSLLSKECGRLATAIFQAADKEEFIIQNGDELILIKLDPEEGCILVQKRVPLIKEQ